MVLNKSSAKNTAAGNLSVKSSPSSVLEPKQEPLFQQSAASDEPVGPVREMQGFVLSDYETPEL